LLTSRVKCSAGHFHAPGRDEPRGNCLVTSSLEPYFSSLPMSSSAPFHHVPNVSNDPPLQHLALSVPVLQQPNCRHPKGPRKLTSVMSSEAASVSISNSAGLTPPCRSRCRLHHSLCLGPQCSSFTAVSCRMPCIIRVSRGQGTSGDVSASGSLTS
jgi:hypothetical protein